MSGNKNIAWATSWIRNVYFAEIEKCVRVQVYDHTLWRSDDGYISIIASANPASSFVATVDGLICAHYRNFVPDEKSS